MEDGPVLNVPMMHTSDTFNGGIIEDLHAKAVLLPYKVVENQICFLPN